MMWANRKECCRMGKHSKVSGLDDLATPLRLLELFFVTL